MYQLSFTKPRAAGVAAALCLLNLVTFSGGVALGVRLWMPVRSDIVLANDDPPAGAEKKPEQPAIPVRTAALRIGAPERSLDAPTRAGRFALQIGSFSDARNAEQLATELTGRGYAIRIFRALDGANRAWHVVRVGDYPDLSTASRAAADFTSRERLQALVCRADILQVPPGL
jgi:cell division protein FtsN